MSILREKSETKPRFLSPSVVVDGGGNTFIAYIDRSAATTDIGAVQIIRITPNGTMTDVAGRTPEAGKCDDCCIVQSGTHLLVFLTVHVGDPVTQLQALPPVVGVCVPYGAAGPQLGARGAFLAGSAAPAGPTADEIANAVSAKLAPQFALVVSNIKPKVAAAIAETGVLTDSTVYASGGMYRRLAETCWEQLTKFLNPKP